MFAKWMEDQRSDPVVVAILGTHQHTASEAAKEALDARMYTGIDRFESPTA